jgi:transcriptional regulator with XRE-family HTH domain
VGPVTPEENVLCSLLRQIRMDAGLRQQDVAERLGQAQSFVSKYEAGDRRLDLFEVRAICTVCRISTVDFVRRLERELAKAPTT